MSKLSHVKTWTPQPLAPDVQKVIDRVRRAPDVLHVAVMPDVHRAGAVNNGVAIATRKLVYPAAVGGDIGCGFATAALVGDVPDQLSEGVAREVLAAIQSAVPIMRHRRRDGLPELVGDTAPHQLSTPELGAIANRDGRIELGTLGRGNHFVELQEDQAGRYWITVHSGSRIMGQQIMAHHLNRATNAGGGLAWLDTEGEAGQAYLNDVHWARAYAEQSRKTMLDAAVAALAQTLDVRMDMETLIHTDHNHVQSESVNGEVVFVHRKGANAATDGATNIICGSMATRSYHVVGRGGADALMSSSHGAGRILSRGAALSRIRKSDSLRQLKSVHVDPKLRGRLKDESPQAYKDIDAVMRAQRELVRIVRYVEPRICHKGA